MSNEFGLAGPLPELDRVLSSRSDFRAFAQDLSDAVLFALERQHLEYLDLQQIPLPATVPSLVPGDLFFLRLAQIGHGPEIERSLDLLNLQNILGTFRGGSHSLVVALTGEGARSRLYFGARKLAPASEIGHGAYDFIQNLRRAVEGNLPGTRFQEFAGVQGPTVACPADEVSQAITHPLGSFPYLAALTGIPSLRAGNDQQFAQSLDRLIQALQGQRYLLLIIAEPVAGSQVSQILSDCFRLGSDLHSWVRASMNQSRTLGESEAQGSSDSRTEGGTETTGRSQAASEGKGRQPAVGMGGLIGAGVALALSPMLGPMSIGIGGLASSLTLASGGSVSENLTNTDSGSRSETWSRTAGESLTHTRNRADSRALTVEYLNKAAEYGEAAINGYIRRLQRAKNLGLWNVGVYFLAEDPVTLEQGRAQLLALQSGRESFFEPMRTVDLSHPRVRHNIGVVLSSFTNPVLELQDRRTHEPLPHPLGKLYRSLSTPLNTEEVALLLNLPRREVTGLKLKLVADFGLNPRPVDPEVAISLGKVVAGGTVLDDLPFALHPADLNRHVFVTGIPGSGKTNTCFALLKAAAKRNIPFLVVEPAKGEYRVLLADPELSDLRVYTLGQEKCSPFRFNPFQFVPGTDLVTHVDHLKSIFNAAFPMYAAMPYLLEEAMVEVYEERGWDLVTSLNSRFDMDAVLENWARGEPDYSYTAHLPRLSDLYHKVDMVVERKGYAREATQNYTAALKARLHSLLLGSKGRMLDTRSGIPYEELFERPTILELRGLGDDDEKAFMMALLLGQLYEFREQQQRISPAKGLRHVAVLEEAHRLLGHAVGAGSLEVANPRGKAVESFANMLAEIRAYGQGLLIVDQSPSRVIPDVVRNTSTKILHRLTAPEDRRFVGEAMSLTETQGRMVPGLEVGHAIVHTEEQDKPVWVKMEDVKAARGPVSDAEVSERMRPLRTERAAADLSHASELARRLAARSRRLGERLAERQVS
jgi:DNA helicase HerA-like ATPase